MLHNIRKFSKTLLAKILLVIIIIPFIFWGMGGVFNSGNSNNIVKINNSTISTQDFMNYINSSRLTEDIVRENIDKNIIEDLLSGLISQKLIEMEIKNLSIKINEKSLAAKIRKNESFKDENKKFSRTKYEKFLLSQNLTASSYEAKLKESELQKKLFFYVSGGIKSPLFLINKTYKNETSKLKVSFVNLQNKYKKEENFTDIEIKTFINENADDLKEEYIDFSYIKISPQNLIGTDDFNELFYKKIDELENKVSNGVTLNELSRELKITPVTKKNFKQNVQKNKIEEKIYQSRNENKIQLVDENDFYVLYEISKINKSLPQLTNKNFKNKIIKILYEKNKYEYNKKILDKINEKKFNQSDFEKIANKQIKQIKLNSINDDSKFSADSVKLLYSLPVNSFTLISDNQKNIYIVKLKKFFEENLNKSSKDLLDFTNQSNNKIKNNIYSSYDYFLNGKYKVKVNQKTLERVKNYFR